jgi:hypothetical protein
MPFPKDELMGIDEKDVEEIERDRDKVKAS